MSELAAQLRYRASLCVQGDPLAALLNESAAELDRLGSILGAAAHYTDSDWAAQVAVQMGVDAAAAGPLFPPPSLKPHAASMVAAATGYWERHLQATAGR